MDEYAYDFSAKSTKAIIKHINTRMHATPPISAKKHIITTPLFYLLGILRCHSQLETIQYLYDHDYL